ncbi:DUF885 domain-containing protein [Pseudonocardia sp. ICBG162]|uniref:DUF885 domain-containing protein n=1 Tax=Pseudonocardia sp. ICBG162 TaxID=2846761 RepID=UPI001CF6C88C|nr:DUF885 domain-containing protein [Pseudonocardia sp. ICBG162]
MDLLHATAELASRVDRLRPGVLDGPPPYPSIARRVAAEPVQDPAALVVTAGRLRAEVAAAGLPDGRRRYLDALLVALRCRARLLAGEDVGYVEQVRDLFGVLPRRSEPDELHEAHRRLATVLPGRGPLAARMRDHRAADVLPAERLAGAVTAVVAELRRRTRDTLGLPDGEHADVDLVGARPWTAFTCYRGGLRSRISVATTGRVRAGSLLPLLAHEAYPGHHLQYCRAEVASARYPELALRLVHSPQGLVAEGAAEAAVAVVPGPGWGAVAERVLAGAGVHLDGPAAERIERELDLLGRVRLDAALMRHVDGAGPDAVLAHLSRWLLVDDDRARRMLDFLDHPQWRTYPVTYAEGGPLVRARLATDPEGPAAALATLLDTPVLPSDLVTDGGAAPGPERGGPPPAAVGVLRPPRLG